MLGWRIKQVSESDFNIPSFLTFCKNEKVITEEKRKKTQSMFQAMVFFSFLAFIYSMSGVKLAFTTLFIRFSFPNVAIEQKDFFFLTAKIRN